MTATPSDDDGPRYGERAQGGPTWGPQQAGPQQGGPQQGGPQSRSGGPGDGTGTGAGPAGGPAGPRSTWNGADQGAPWNQGAWGAPPPPLRPEDQRLWATLVHVGGIFFTFLVPLVGYLLLRDRGPFVREHARVCLNFHLTMLIAYLIGVITSWLGIGLLVLLAVAVVSIVFGIIAALRANAGEFYVYPLTIEFIKE